MLERRKQPLLPNAKFARRVAIHLLIALIAVTVALSIGIFGYHFVGGLTWVDSLLNASMILGGMGPVDRLDTSSAKVFASAYALFSGLVFIGVASLIILPFIHRLLHRFHLDKE